MGFDNVWETKLKDKRLQTFLKSLTNQVTVEVYSQPSVIASPP
jgi:hypothetical protein